MPRAPHLHAWWLSPVLPLQRDCHNYIKMLLQLNSTHLYTCGTCAFSPACAYIVSMGKVLGGPVGSPVPGVGGGHCAVLTAPSPCRTCSTSAWSEMRREGCCWKTGRDAAPSTPSTGPPPSWSVRHALPRPLRRDEPRTGTGSPGGSGSVSVPGPSRSLSLADGELYAGTVSNFQGNEPTIYRSQESRIALKTENSLNWLQGEGGRDRRRVVGPGLGRSGDGDGDGVVLKAPVPPDPVFVGSAYLRESLPASNPEGDDDKVYFFFSETGKEFDYFENTIVSRIARVCKVSAGQRGHTWGGCAQGVADAGQGDVGLPCTCLSLGRDQHLRESPLGQSQPHSAQPRSRLLLLLAPLVAAAPPCLLCPRCRGHKPVLLDCISLLCTLLCSCLPSSGAALARASALPRGQTEPLSPQPARGPCSMGVSPWGSPVGQRSRRALP